MVDERIVMSQTQMMDDAREMIEKDVLEYARGLTQQAKILAADDGYVLKKHVSEAREILREQRKPTKWAMLAITGGGVLFGSFLTGFPSAIKTNSIPLLVFFVTLGMIGLALFFLGVQS